MAVRDLLEDKKVLTRAHSQSLVMENRERVSFTGVMDVESFNEDEVVLVTELGICVLTGIGLHITKLNLDDGQLVTEGQIIALEYVDSQKSGKKEGLFSRVFR